MTFVDIDGDTDLDVVVANGRHWPQANEVFVNIWKGTFHSWLNAWRRIFRDYAVPTADIDGDGDFDLIVANGNAPNMIYLNNGMGRFSYAGTIGPEVEPTRDVILADLNGDKRPDAIVTNRGAENGFYLNKNKGKFGKKRGSF